MEKPLPDGFVRSGCKGGEYRALLMKMQPRDFAFALGISSIPPLIMLVCGYMFYAMALFLVLVPVLGMVFRGLCSNDRFWFENHFGRFRYPLKRFVA